jgi:hypothetical protein
VSYAPSGGVGVAVVQTVSAATGQVGAIHSWLDMPLLDVLFRLIGLSLLAALVAGTAAFLFRWRTGNQFPESSALLLGLGGVAVSLNTRIALVQFLGTGADVLTPTEVVVNMGVLVAGSIAAIGGWYYGDRLGTSKRLTQSLQPTISPLVRATGRFITVQLPEEIEDIDGYDPVSETTREQLAGATYDFSRGMTVAELREAVGTRLRTDHDIAHVDVELTVDGNVEYLAVGRRASGLGPTLPPGSEATAIRADPALSATAGDTIQVWDGTAGERVATGELRAVAGQTATVSARAEAIDNLDPDVQYRLMTLSADERVDRTFASMLRRADETMNVVTVAEGATLVGSTVGELGLSVIAISDASGTLSTIPTRDRKLAAGDKLFAIGHPTQLRRLEAAASGTASYELPLAVPTTAGKPGTRRSRLGFRRR